MEGYRGSLDPRLKVLDGGVGGSVMNFSRNGNIQEFRRSWCHSRCGPLGLKSRQCLRNCGQFKTKNLGDLTEYNSNDCLKCGTLAKQEGSTRSLLLDILIPCGTKVNLLGQGEETGFLKSTSTEFLSYWPWEWQQKSGMLTWAGKMQSSRNIKQCLLANKTCLFTSPKC